jgi:hypothetical protein
MSLGGFEVPRDAAGCHALIAIEFRRDKPAVAVGDPYDLVGIEDDLIEGILDELAREAVGAAFERMARFCL